MGKFTKRIWISGISVVSSMNSMAMVDIGRCHTQSFSRTKATAVTRLIFFFFFVVVAVVVVVVLIVCFCCLFLFLLLFLLHFCDLSR